MYRCMYTHMVADCTFESGSVCHFHQEIRVRGDLCAKFTPCLHLPAPRMHFNILQVSLRVGWTETLV